MSGFMMEDKSVSDQTVKIKPGINEEPEDRIGEGFEKICKFCSVHGGVWRCDQSDEMMCDGCFTWHVKSNPGTIEDFDVNEWTNIKSESGNDTKLEDSANVTVESSEGLEKICKFCSVHDGVWRCVQSDEMMCEGCYTWHVKSNPGTIKDFDVNEWNNLKTELRDDGKSKDGSNVTVESSEAFEKICKFCSVHDGVWRCVQSDEMMCDGCYTWHVKSNPGTIKDFDVNEWRNIKSESGIDRKREEGSNVTIESSEGLEKICKFCSVHDGVWRCVQSDEMMCNGCYTWHVKSNPGTIKDFDVNEWTNINSESGDDTKLEDSANVTIESSESLEKICKFCSVHDGVWRCVQSDEMLCDGCYTWHVKSNPGTIKDFDVNEWKNLQTETVNDRKLEDSSNVTVESSEVLEKICKFCSVHDGVWRCLNSDKMMCDGCYTWHVKSNPGTIKDFDVNEWINIKSASADDSKLEEGTNVTVKSSIPGAIKEFDINEPKNKKSESIEDRKIEDGANVTVASSNPGAIKDFDMDEWKNTKSESGDDWKLQDGTNVMIEPSNPGAITGFDINESKNIKSESSENRMIEDGTDVAAESSGGLEKICKFCSVHDGVWRCVQSDEMMCDGCYTWHVKSNPGTIKDFDVNEWKNIKSKSGNDRKLEDSSNVTVESSQDLEKICKFCSVHDGVWRCVQSDEMMCDGCYTWHVKSNAGAIEGFDITEWKKLKTERTDEGKPDDGCNTIVGSSEGLKKICKFCSVHDGVWRCVQNDEMMCDGCYTWHVKSNPGTVKDFDVNEWTNKLTDSRDDENVNDGSSERLEKICKFCSVQVGVWRCIQSDEMMCDGCYTWHVKSNAGAIEDFDVNKWNNIKTKSRCDVKPRGESNVMAETSYGLEKICSFCNVNAGVWKCNLSDKMMCDGCYTWHVKSNAGTIDFDINSWTHITNESLDDVKMKTKKSSSSMSQKCHFCSFHDGVWRCVQNDEIMCDGCYTWHVKSNEGQVKGFRQNDWMNLKNENTDSLKVKQTVVNDCSNGNTRSGSDWKVKDTTNDISNLRLTLQKCIDAENVITKCSNDFRQSVSVMTQEVYIRAADLKCKIDQTTDSLMRMLQQLNQQSLEKVANLELKLHEEISDIKTALRKYEDKEKDIGTNIHRGEKTEYICMKCQSSNIRDQNDGEVHEADDPPLEETISYNYSLDTFHSTDSLKLTEICKSDQNVIQDQEENNKSISIESIHANKENYKIIDNDEKIKKSFIDQHLQNTEENQVNSTNDTKASSVTVLLQPKKESKTVTIHIKESLHTLKSTEENNIRTNIDMKDSEVSTSSLLLQTSENTETAKSEESQHIMEYLQYLLCTQQRHINTDVEEVDKKVKIKESETEYIPSLSLNFESNEILPLESDDYKPSSRDSDMYKSLSLKKDTSSGLNFSPEFEERKDSKFNSVIHTSDLVIFPDKSTVLADTIAYTTPIRDQPSLPGGIENKASTEVKDSLPQIKSNQSITPESLVRIPSTEISHPVPHPPPAPSSSVKNSTLERNDRQVRFIQFPHPPLTNKSSCRNVLATEAKVIYSFNIKENRSRVAAITRGQAWFWSCSKSVLTLVASDGHILDNINTDFPVYDVATTKSGELLVTQSDGKTVMRMSAKKTFSSAYRAPIGYTTRGITVKDNGDFIVVLYRYRGSKLVEVNANGQTIKFIESYDVRNTKKIFINPYIICININGDIIVSEEDKVVGVTSSGVGKYTYTLPAKSLKSAFNPVYTVTDKYGHVIISDYNNSVLHLLDEDGRFIQYMLAETPGCSQPAGLSIDSSGKLWVCCTGENNLFIIKYLSL